MTLGLSVNRAAGKVKVHHSTIAEWRRNDPDFDAAVQNAEAVFIENQIKTIQAAAKNGTWVAAAWLLERKFPSEFSQPQVQLHHGVIKLEFEDFGQMIEKLRGSPEASGALQQSVDPSNCR